MSESSIKKHVETIQKATQKALRSKKSALKFLVDAGIVKKSKNILSKRKEK